MDSNIRLAYGRTGETYSGEILVEIIPTRGMLSWANLREVPFNQLMSKLARCIREQAASGEVKSVVLSRTEAAGSALSLDRATIELMINDPAAAIRSMAHPDTVVHVRDQPTVTSGLKVGLDILSDAFGEEVYIKRHGDFGECPACGRWKLVLLFPATLDCSECRLSVKGTMYSMTWISVPVRNLLDTSKAKFFLPRLWNAPGPWISRADLSTRLEIYLKEKSQCMQDLKA